MPTAARAEFVFWAAQGLIALPRRKGRSVSELEASRGAVECAQGIPR